MNRIILCILVLLLTPTILSAHPGRTASGGCHYCRTNCDKWGVPEGKRHCHRHRINEIQTKSLKSYDKRISTSKESGKVLRGDYRMDIQQVNIKSKKQKVK